MIRVDLNKGNSIICDNMYIHEGKLHCFIKMEAVGKAELNNIAVIYEEV